MSVSKETKEQVLQLRLEGLTYEQIAKKVKIRKSTVGQIVRSQDAADVKEGMIRQSTENPLPEFEILDAKVLKAMCEPKDHNDLFWGKGEPGKMRGNSWIQLPV